MRYIIYFILTDLVVVSINEILIVMWNYDIVFISSNEKLGAVNLRMNLLLVMVIDKQIQPVPYMI